MEIIDYGRSFLQGTAEANSVRFWVESRTELVDEETGDAETYWQCAACVSEDTFAERGLFRAENYTFLPIFSEKYLVIFRRGASEVAGRPYRTLQAADASWGEMLTRAVRPGQVEKLETNAAIREATNAGYPLVARTEVHSEETRRRMTIEYPVKTMNIHNTRDLYQVDTGPVAYFDLAGRPACTAEGLSLAFVAFNAPHFADFVLEVPTALAPDCRVHHWSPALSLPARNEVFAIME